MFSIPSRWIFLICFDKLLEFHTKLGQNFITLEPSGFHLNLFFISIFCISHNLLFNWNFKSLNDIFFRKCLMNHCFFIFAFQQHRICTFDWLKLFWSNCFVIIYFFNSYGSFNLWHHLACVEILKQIFLVLRFEIQEGINLSSSLMDWMNW